MRRERSRRLGRPGIEHGARAAPAVCDAPARFGVLRPLPTALAPSQSKWILMSRRAPSAAAQQAKASGLLTLRYVLHQSLAVRLVTGYCGLVLCQPVLPTLTASSSPSFRKATDPRDNLLATYVPLYSESRQDCTSQSLFASSRAHGPRTVPHAAAGEGCSYTRALHQQNRGSSTVTRVTRRCFVRGSRPRRRVSREPTCPYKGTQRAQAPAFFFRGTFSLRRQCWKQGHRWT